MMKRLAVILLVCLTAGFVFANGSGEKSTGEDKVELLIYVFIHDGARQVMNSLGDHSVVQELERMTGYDLEFMHPPAGDDGTFFNTTIASGEYPDLFQDNFNTYPGGPDGAIDDGVLIDMNDLIAEHAPNWNARIAGAGEAIRKKTVSDNGTIIRFGTIFQCELLEGKAHRGMMMRQDILEDLGMAVPQTTAQFLEVLRAMKANDLIDVPLALPKASDSIGWGGDYGGSNAIASAFGVAHRKYYIRDGKVAFGPAQPEYKAYLAYLNTLYEEGLLYEDFPNIIRSDAKKMLAGSQAGATVLGNWETRQVLMLGQADNPDFDLAPVPVLKMNEGDPRGTITNVQESVNNRAWFVSSTCKHPVEAVKLIDLLHDEEVNSMLAWGLQEADGNKIWEVVDGTKQFTDFIQSNPEMDFATARARYTLNPFQTRWAQDMEVQQYNHPKNIEAWDVWSASATNTDMLPNSMTLTIDESREHASLMNSIETYSDEMFYKFVTGLEPLDNFDEYLDEIKSMDIDRAVGLQQAAYERYFKR